MATEATTPAPETDEEYEQLFADWVYYIPGALLIAVGFGTIAFLALA
jgi:hypothetical protein